MKIPHQYVLNLNTKDKNAHLKFANSEIDLLAKFISQFTQNLKLNIDISTKLLQQLTWIE